MPTPQEAHSLISLIGFKSKSFSLLWRGSRDGFDPSTFHQRCDGKPNTLTLIKNKLDYVFCGYTAVPWSSLSSGTYHSDATAFLFTLTNPSNNPLKLKVIKPEKVVVHSSVWGPGFGVGDLRYYSFDDSDNCMDFESCESPNGLDEEEGGKYVLGGTSNFYKTLDIEVFEKVNQKLIISGLLIFF